MFDAATQALTGASYPHTLPSPALWYARKGKADCGLRWRCAAHWVNPDGSHPRTRVAVRAGDGALVLTGDVAAYNQAHPGDVVYEVVSAAIAPRRAHGELTSFSAICRRSIWRATEVRLSNDTLAIRPRNE